MKYPETARRLALALESKGIRAIDLSTASGVGKSSISHYLNGNNCPTNINAGKMAKVLEVNPVWLMGFDVPPKDIELEVIVKELTPQSYDRLLDYAKFLRQTQS